MREQEQSSAMYHHCREGVTLSTWDRRGDDGGGWGDDDASDDNDWGTGEEAGKGDCSPSSSMDDLHAMLAAMEMKENQDTKMPKGKDNNIHISNNPRMKKEDPSIHIVEHAHSSDGDSVTINAFPKYDLDVYDEPFNINGVQDVDSDDEDVQDTTNDKDIQNLLSKYLTEEDDSDILSAIKGGSSSLSLSMGGSGSGRGHGNGEKYERLPPEERTFLIFPTRIKRAPKQSARYAYGGVPLWSM